MKKFISILVLLVCFTINLLAEAQLDEYDYVYIFKPDIIYTISFEDVKDLVYLLGTLESGERIAVWIANKDYDSGDIGSFEYNVYFDNVECNNINDVMEYGRVTWYKVYSNYSTLAEIDNSNPIYLKLINKGVDYVIRVRIFEYIPPIELEELRQESD